MNYLSILILAFMVALIIASAVHPAVVKIARAKDITDNPDKRKLQREPVPVLGGMVVFFGIVMGMAITEHFCNSQDIMLIFSLILVMLYTGTADDIVGLSPTRRFIIEILAAIVLIFIGGYEINDFYGLLGIHKITPWLSIPLTVIIVVGIINAINLIDGVDGLSSGYCIMSCAIFGLYFYHLDDMIMALLAVSCIGALIPFFIHNVFGRTSKMFIGDGGTLMMGIILSIFVLRILDADFSNNHFKEDFGVIPFTLAVLAIPVFDTLRVMIMRLVHGTSPFLPDKTHLHHAFIELNFTHLQTTLSILLLNIVIVIVFLLLHKLSCPTSIIFTLLLIVGCLFTFGIYNGIKRYFTNTL